ncbi:MAG: DUF721 domain-containing protein [Firmicutes bacterium]|nr:DUF721 domain-containing protein [Bacillota bacterium]
MKQLREIINGLLQSRGLWSQFKISELIFNWDEIIGESLSTVTRATDFNRGRLRVLVEDPVWGHHLSLMKPQIIERLNRYLGKKIIKEIYFQVGEVKPASGKKKRAAAGSREEQFSRGQEFKNNIKKLQDLIDPR